MPWERLRFLKATESIKRENFSRRQGLGRNLTREEAADILYNLLRDINRKAVAKGVLPDMTGSVGILTPFSFLMRWIK